MESMAKCLAAVLLLLFISQDCYVIGNPVAEHKIVKRTAAIIDKTIGFVSGTFSNCVGVCTGATPAGVRTRSRNCIDQDSIRLPLCSALITDNCCQLVAFFAEPVFEACNPNCASTDAPELPIGTFELTNGDGSVTNVTISVDGSGTRSTVVMTTELDGAIITSTENRQSDGTRTLNVVVNPPPPDMFDVQISEEIFIFTAAIFRVNGANVVTIPRENNLLRQTASGGVIEYENSVATLLSLNVSVTITENAPTFYYISPFGLTYIFDGNKVTAEMGEGVFFVDSANSVAIFSQYSPASNLLLQNSVNTYQIQNQANNEIVFRLNVAQNFGINNVTELTTSGETLEYSNGALVAGSSNTSASVVYILGSTGFEVFDSDASATFEGETFVSDYDAVFYNDVNGGQVLISTSPILSENIRQGMSYISGNSIQLENAFQLDGSAITFQGVDILDLTTTERIPLNGPSTETIIYSGNNLISSTLGTRTVNEFFVRQTTGLLASMGRSMFLGFINSGGVVYIDGMGNALAIDTQSDPLFTTDTSFIDDSLDAVMNPELPTAPTDAMFSLVREGMQVFLQIASMNVLEATAGDCSSLAASASDTLTYNNGIVTIQTAGTSVSNVNMLTVAIAGQNVQLLTNAVTGFSVPIDSSYQLRVCGDKAVLTNDNSVQMLYDSAVTLPGVVVVNNQRTLFLGSMLALPLTGDVVMRSITTDNEVRLRNDQIIISENGTPIQVVNAINNGLRRFLATDDVVMSVTMIDGTAGTLYALQGDRAIFTDRTMIMDIIANELAFGFEVATDSNTNQTVLRTDGSDVVILNGVENINIASDESLRFSPSTDQLEILDSSNNVIRSFNGVNEVSSFLLGGPATVQMLSSMMTINGPLSLYAQSRLGDYFITDNSIVQNLVSEATPIPSVTPTAIDGGNDNIILTIGAEAFVINEMQSILSGSNVQYSNSMLTFGSTTLPNINEFLVYLSSDVMPQTNTGSAADTPGPGQLYYNDGRALFTDRQDVIDLVNSITPVPPPTVTTRTEQNGRVVLVIGDQDIIALNEREMVPVTGSQIIEFTGSAIIIRNSNDNSIVASFDGIDTISGYLTGDTTPQSFTDPQIVTETPGQLVLTSTRAFYSNRPDVTSVLGMEFDLLTEVDDNDDLVVGGETIIQLNNSARVDVGDNEQVVISGTTITVLDRDTNAIIRTFTGVDNPIRYLSSDGSPVSNPGDVTIPGPATIVVDIDEGDAIITNRPEVIESISSVLAGTTIIPSLSFGLRDRNGTTVLVIDSMDIIAIDDGIIRMLNMFEEVSYDSTNMVLVRNFIGGIETGSPNPLIATQLIRYLSTDSSPVAFMNTGPSTMGPLTLYYQPNDSPSTVLITDRSDIAMLLREALDNFTASATPAPVTPEPPVPQVPEPVDIINDDGTRWTTSPWSECSRNPCGVGVRIRSVICRTAEGDPATICDQPGQRTANNIPASVELCNVEDCVGESRNGIPRDETVTFSSGAGEQDIRAIVRISDSDVGNEAYTIEIMSLDRVSGSVVREKIENIDGVQSRVAEFELRTEPVPIMTDVVREGMTLLLQVNGDTLFVVDPVPRDSFPGDQCFEVQFGELIEYSNRTLQYGSNVFDNILAVITSERVIRGANSVATPFTFAFMDNLQSIDFGDLSGDRPAFGIDSGSVLCVSPAMQSAFIGGLADPSFSPEDTDFINSVISGFDMISSTLSAPMIMPEDSSPMDEITTSGRVIQVGTPEVEIREDIFYFSLRCELSDEGNPPYTQRIWTRDGTELPNNNIKFSITDETLLIKNINENDEGNYTCSVSNAVGTDEATTMIFVNDKPVPMRPEVVQPTDPSPPDWVPGSFSDCSEPVCGVGIRVRAVICRDPNGQQSQACDGNNVPQTAELCNTQDCPEGPARNGAPPVNVTSFTVPIFNGDVDITVDVTSSDPATGDYMLTVTSDYPDQTTIVQMLSDMGDDTTVTTTTTFGPELLFGRIESIRNGGRIDIRSSNVLFSILPQIGDQCFNVNSSEQFLYSDNRIINRPNTFEDIQFVIGAENEGVSSYEESTNRIFTGALTLCVSTFHNRAFFTDIPALAEMILDQYDDILDDFVAPMIRRVNETEVKVNNPFVATFAEIGQTIRAPEGSPIFITVQLSEPGTPTPSEVTWTFNGEPLEMDADKGVFFTSGRYTLIINELFSDRVGQYEATVMNPVGSDSVTSSIILEPVEGIIIENRMSTPPVFNIGIGTDHNIDRRIYSTSNVLCEVATNETSADIRFLINGAEATTGNPPGVVIALGATSALLTRPLSADGTTVYTCEATVGNSTFTETSIVDVMTSSPPTAITFTGNPQINVGESRAIVCSADGVPTPVSMFNEVRLGMDEIVSDFVFSGDTLNINEAIYGDDSEYCCEATNEAGSITDCITITLMIPPMIVRPDEPDAIFVPLPPGTPFPLVSPLPMFFAMVGQMVTIPRGSILQIRCQAAGSPEPVIEWFVNGTMSTENAIGENFTITVAQPEDSGTYECRVSNAAGTDTLTTVVTVVSPPVVRPSSDDITELSTPDTVVTVEQPSDLFVLDGLDFCLRCDFDPGVPPADTIQWQRNGDNINIRDACLSFAANRTQLCFDSITRPYSDVYTCRVSNIAGSDNGSINVIVAESPRIAFPAHRMLPAPGQCDSQFDMSFVSEDVGVNLCVSPAARIIIDCVVSGDPKPAATIEWRFNETGQILGDNDTGITILPNNSLLIESINEAESVGGSGTYICRASNFAGSHERSSTIRASGETPVIDTTRVRFPFQDDRFVTNVGSAMQTVTLQRFSEIQILCSSEGSPTPQITWTVNSLPISEDAQLFNIMSDGSLLISGLIRTECSEYTCTATNPVGQVSESVTICGETFECLHSGFGECSQTCGTGIREATFECNRTFDGNSSPYSYNFISSSIRPFVEPETCGPGDLCPQPSFRFVATEFSECSKVCGCGRQYRTIQCFDFLGEEQLEEVDIRTCSLYADNQTLPSPLSQSCNNFTCPEWRVGNFSECTQECGFMGNQTREVFCVAPDNGNLTINDSFCENNAFEARPYAYQRCNRFHCPYQFVTNAWSPCSTTCRGGVRTRTVSCYDAEKGEVIDDALCVRELGEERRPTTLHLCGTGACPAQFAWNTGSYGPCSVTCGDGVRSRSVDCISAKDKSTVLDIMCIANKRPGDTIPCFPIPCPSGDCVSENVLCSIAASVGLCDALRPRCCISCPM